MLGYKKSPASSYRKETVLSLHKNLAVPLFLPLDATTHDGPTTVSRCIGRAPSALLTCAFGTAAQRPVYNFRHDRLTPPGGSLNRAWKLLFPLQSVFSMCGELYHQNRKVSSTETQKSTRKGILIRRGGAVPLPLASNDCVVT